MKLTEKIEAKKGLSMFSLKFREKVIYLIWNCQKLKAHPITKFLLQRLRPILKAGIEGLKGYVLANYVLIPNKSGNLDIKTEEFCFF